MGFAALSWAHFWSYPVSASPEAAKVRARLAANKRWHPESPTIQIDQLEYRTLKLADHIREVVDTLTEDQRRRLADLLRP